MAQLPIVTINNRDYYADLRLREFRAVDDPHTRISHSELLRNPAAYAFTEPIQRGRTIVYTRQADGRLTVAVADHCGRESFGDFPLLIRMKARAELYLNSTFEENEKLMAAAALPKACQRLVWDDLLCRRADAIHLKDRKRDEQQARIEQVLATPAYEGALERKLRLMLARKPGRSR